MPLRLVGLVRVSGRTQARDGHSLDNQRAVIRAWCMGSGDRVTAWCVEDGVSGAAPLPDRVGITTALGLIRTGKADGLIVANLDRLSRDIIVQEQVWAEVTHIGGVMRSTRPAEDHALIDDPRDPSRALVRRIFASLAAYERDMVALRLSAGRDAKAIRGGYLHGRPPFGWRAQGKELVPDPEEQPVLRRIFREHNAGLSYAEIAAGLNHRNIPAKMGGNWSKSVVRKVILRGPGTPLNASRNQIKQPPKQEAGVA